MYVYVHVICDSFTSSIYFSPLVRAGRVLKWAALKKQLETLKNFLKSDEKLSFVKVLGITFELLKIV